MQIMLEERSQNSPQVRDTRNRSVFISTDVFNFTCVIFLWEEKHKELQARHDISILELQDKLEVAEDNVTTLSK